MPSSAGVSFAVIAAGTWRVYKKHTIVTARTAKSSKDRTRLLLMTSSFFPLSSQPSLFCLQGPVHSRLDKMLLSADGTLVSPHVLKRNHCNLQSISKLGWSLK